MWKILYILKYSKFDMLEMYKDIKDNLSIIIFFPYLIKNILSLLTKF